VAAALIARVEALLTKVLPLPRLRARDPTEADLVACQAAVNDFTKVRVSPLFFPGCFYCCC
jgi:hypothetical protein